PTLRGRWGRLALPRLLLRVGGQGTEFVAWVVFARRLGTADFGRLSVAFLLCRYGGLVADWGASVRGPRDVAADRDPAVIHALARRRTTAALALSAAFLAGAVATSHRDLAAVTAVILAGGASRDWLALGNERGVRSSLPFAL